MTSFTVRMDDKVHRKLKKLAKEERRSINEQISWLVENFNKFNITTPTVPPPYPSSWDSGDPPPSGIVVTNKT